MSFPKRRSVSKIETRPRQRLGRNLEKDLLAYAAAASAGLLSTALPADAQVVFTPSNTPMAIAQVNKGPAFTPLDLNNDGIPDFSFAMLSDRGTRTSTYRFKFYLKVVPGQPGNEAVQGAQAPTASAVPAGVTIGSKEKFARGGLYMAINSYNHGTRNSGTWQSVEFAYVGLKFLINGQTHYGWARVKFPYPGGTAYPSIYGYAYESTPNQPIMAGQTRGSSNETTRASAPATLGVLAAGASGLDIWRTQGSATPIR